MGLTPPDPLVENGAGNQPAARLDQGSVGALSMLRPNAPCVYLSERTGAWRLVAGRDHCVEVAECRELRLRHSAENAGPTWG